MKKRVLVLLVALLALVCGSAPLSFAQEKSYSAERFDVEWSLTENGDLDVIESVEFRFEGGPFTYVFRELTDDYSDGVADIQASLDGQVLPAGTGAGQVEISGRNPVKVTWHFPPASDLTRTFELRYRMLGVIRQETGADLFFWNALPTDYEYPIARSTVRLSYPAGAQPVGPAEVRRGRAEVTAEDGQFTFTAADLAAGTPLTIAVAFTPGSLVAAAPVWQERARSAREAMPGFAAAALAALAAGAAGLYALWARGRRSVVLSESRLRTSTLPGDVPPAMAGALTAASGRPGAYHALAALFSLAQRGVLVIEEDAKRGWGRPRDFLVRQVDPDPRELRPNEAGLLELMFSNKAGRNDSVKVSELGGRLSSKLKRFAKPLTGELRSAGLIDPEREAFGRRYMVIGIALLVAILPLLGLAILLIERFGPYPMLLPAAAFLLSMTAFVLSGVYSPLSDEGAREAKRWRGFADYLKDVTKGREPAWDLQLFDRYLPYAAAFGLAEGWAKAFQKRGGAEIPGWFRAMTQSPDGSLASFVVLMSAANSAGSAGAGGGAGGGGAGGGGGSGAG